MMNPPKTLALAGLGLAVFLTACKSTNAPAQAAAAPTPPATTQVNQTDAALAAAASSNEDEPMLLQGPNAVPKDTRVVVNIPAFRMDLFADGNLVKSYRIGIGYPQFQIPRGLRTAQIVIFNPTWTQPHESWASNPGAIVPAGSKNNPLGPIKIPIGGASLIHGGKPLEKIGAFASHGCVGMTNDQVKDFARLLVGASGTDLTEESFSNYLEKRTRTQVVKLEKLVPVELRYETIVLEDGRLHVYRDVYNQNTNTEENLRTLLESSGVRFNDLSEGEKAEMLDALNAMSNRPQKKSAPKPAPTASQTPADKALAAATRKTQAEREKQLRNQKEIVIEIKQSTAKGYPAPVNFDTGAGLK
jgi:lipoprotein-anchoring transpeptidase ErfK/SrfK